MNRTRLLLLGLVLGSGLLAGCERPPVDTVQRGYRGTGMELVYNPRTHAEQAPNNVAPAPLDPASPDGPKAGQVYQNVQVLGNLSVSEFTRTMVAMTNWVAPKNGCVHCHNPQNFAEDTLYTKVVARRMLLMTQSINGDWQKHVGKTGVTCFTCHRGEPVPKEVWFKPLDPKGMNNFAGDKAGQNMPAVEAGLTSLPADPYSAYLLDNLPIRVQGETALPDGNRHSTKQAEFTYSLMIHMSKALGVNCAQCHNSRAFGDWGNSSPPRVTAWHGIQMARTLNQEYMVPLTNNFPANRLGPGGDVAKVNCATCHQGAHKPLYGAEMAKHHPELLTKSAPVAAAAGTLTAGDVKVLQQAVPVSTAAK
jgi:photosynthetic reaction center cytochrome c subunit